MTSNFSSFSVQQMPVPVNEERLACVAAHTMLPRDVLKLVEGFLWPQRLVLFDVDRTLISDQTVQQRRLPTDKPTHFPGDVIEHFSAARIALKTSSLYWVRPDIVEFVRFLQSKDVEVGLASLNQTDAVKNLPLLEVMHTAMSSHLNLISMDLALPLVVGCLRLRLCLPRVSAPLSLHSLLCHL